MVYAEAPFRRKLKKKNITTAVQSEYYYDLIEGELGNVGLGYKALASDALKKNQSVVQGVYFTTEILKGSLADGRKTK